MYYLHRLGGRGCRLGPGPLPCDRSRVDHLEAARWGIPSVRVGSEHSTMMYLSDTLFFLVGIRVQVVSHFNGTREAQAGKIGNVRSVALL